MKKISLIIAAYNVEKYIKKCILSCLNQNIDISDYEVIVVNDGSTDKTLEIIKKFDNVKLVSQKNKGLGAARNEGLKASSGKYIWFIDGDDFIEKNILQKILAKLFNNKLDGLVLNYNVMDENEHLIIKNAYKPIFNKAIIDGQEYYKHNYKKSYSFLHIFKREIFISNNIHFKERINMQDSEILPRILLFAQKLSFLQIPAYNYIQRETSFTNTSNGAKRYKYFESIIIVKKSLNKLLKILPNNKSDLKTGIKKKTLLLHQIIFYHIVFFKYSKNDLKKIIKLLKQNNLFPLRYQAKGKLKIIKVLLNFFPIFTKKIIDLII